MLRVSPLVGLFLYFPAGGALPGSYSSQEGKAENPALGTETAATVDQVDPDQGQADPARNEDSGAKESTELPEVTVLGRRQPKGATRVTWTRYEPLAWGGESPDRVLEGSPGVDVVRHPKKGAGLVIRGLDSRAGQLLIDGVPVSENYAGGFDLTTLGADHFQTVAVERGIVSLLHGPNSQAGVVSLSSELKVADRRAQAALMGGQWRDSGLLDRGWYLAGGKRIGAFTVSAALTSRRSDGFLLSNDFHTNEWNESFHEDGGVRDGSDRELNLMTLRSEYCFAPRLRVQLVGHLFLTERGIPPFESSNYVRYWRFSKYDTGLGILSAEWTPLASGSTGLERLRASVFGTHHEDRIEDYEDATYQKITSNPLAWFAKSDYDNFSVGGTLTPVWRLSRSNRLSATARVVHDSHDSRTLPVGKDKEWEEWRTSGCTLLNAAAEDAHEFGPVTLGGGVGAAALLLAPERIRGVDYEPEENFKWDMEARLFSEYRPTSLYRLMLTLGRKLRFPTLKELYSGVAGGNPELEPERAWMAEGGADLVDLPILSGLTVGGRVFYYKMLDLIDKPVETFVNIDSASIAGAEGFFALRPLSFLECGAFYTYLYAVDDETGRKLDYRSKHFGSATLAARFPFGLTLSVREVFRSGQESWFFDMLSGDWRHDRLPGHFLLDAQVRQRFGLGGAGYVSLFVSGTNLLDTDYVVGGFSPQPGRTVWVGLSADFGK